MNREAKGVNILAELYFLCKQDPGMRCYRLIVFGRKWKTENSLNYDSHVSKIVLTFSIKIFIHLYFVTIWNHSKGKKAYK